jgi:tetratricopeptide (TPR) repeat protein
MRVVGRRSSPASNRRRAQRYRFSLALVWLFLGCLAFGAAENESTMKLFLQANSEYQKNNFGSAEQIYRRILDSGLENGPLFYNLGNACFKQKRLGEAIWYWEKALQRMPGDQDTRENLEMAGLLIVDRIEVPADPLPVRVLERFQDYLSISQQSWLVLILFIAANAILSVYLLSKNSRSAFRAFIGFIVLGLMFIVLGCSWSWRIYQKNHTKEGILVEQKVDALSGPGIQNMTLFTIHEGIKVRVHDSTNGWYQISLPNGWNGWLPQRSLRLL